MKDQYVAVWSDCVVGPFNSKKAARQHVRKQFESAAAMRDDLSWTIKPLTPPESL